MSSEKHRFRHDSLQNAEDLQDILKSIGKGLAKGKVSFVEEDAQGTNTIEMEPEGLMDLKVTASKEEGKHRINIRISWQVDEPEKKNRSLKVD